MKFLQSVILASLFVLAASTLEGQTYKNAIGIRVDNSLSVTYQQYITNGWTAEAILHTPFRTSDELGLTLLAEKHRKLLFRGINLYAGGGAHYYWSSTSNDSPKDVGNNVYGLSGIGGAEISIGRVNISADWKPELHLSGDQVRPFEWTGAAISARIILNKRERRRLFKRRNKKKKGKRFWGEIFEN